MKADKNSEGYEKRDADALSVTLVAALVVMMAFLVALISAGLFHYYNARPLAADEQPASVTGGVLAGEPPRAFPEPRLQVAPEQDLKALRARDDAELHTYAWIDRNTGAVRIPIERAMELLLEKGLPVRGQPGASSPHLTDLQLQQARPAQSTFPR